MFCSKCGKDQIGSPRFCRSCGVALGSPAVGSHPVAGTEGAAQNPDQGKPQNMGARGATRKPPLIDVPVVGWFLYRLSLNHIVNVALRLRRGKPGSFWGYDLFSGILMAFIFWVAPIASIGLLADSLLGLEADKGVGEFIVGIFAITGIVLATMAGVRTYRWAVERGVGDGW